MYSWDELEYKANYVCFISNESTEKQVQIASAVVNKLEEPVYDCFGTWAKTVVFKAKTLQP